VSIHDQELATAALRAQTAFAGASNNDLWTTMLDNLERSAPVERQAAVSTMAMRIEGQLQDVESVTWGQIAACAEGRCDQSLTEEIIALTGETALGTDFDGQSTSDKIAETAVEIAQIGKEIAELSTLMVADPSGANETGMLTEAPTSPLADSIALVNESVETLEEKLAVVKEEKLARLRDALDGLTLPPAFDERTATIRGVLERGIVEIRSALDSVTDFGALSATAAMESERLLMAAGIPLDDNADRAIARSIRSAFDRFFEPIEVHLAATRELLTEAEQLITASLGEGTPPSERLATITDLLRKAEHLDLLKPDSLAEVLERAVDRPVSGDAAEALGVTNVGQLLALIEKPDAPLQELADNVSIQGLFEELRSEPLSTEFSAALKLHTGREIGSVGSLLDYLGTDESRIQEVRVALMTDWRRAVVEGRAFTLESLRYRLGLTEKLGRALEAQQLGEEALAAQLQATQACLTTLDLDEAVFETLGSIARGTALPFIADPDEVCERTFGNERKQFQNLLGIVGDHFKRIGYLHDNERLAYYELVRYEHRRSIEASRFAAAAHEQLIRHGLQGLVAFTQGGITTEQVATVLRFINVGLLTEIANQE
jgi:hypothetical protein